MFQKPPFPTEMSEKYKKIVFYFMKNNFRKISETIDLVTLNHYSISPDFSRSF